MIMERLGEAEAGLRSLTEAIDTTTPSGRMMMQKVLPAIGQRVVVAEAVTSGLTVVEYAPGSAAREEFRVLAKAVWKLL